jgi:hypothetical protein
MHAGKQNPEIEYKMKLKDGTGRPSSCVEEKDLGVIFDRTLSFRCSYTEGCNKSEPDSWYYS